MLKSNMKQKRRIMMNIALCDDNPTFLKSFHRKLQSNVAKLDWVCKYSLFYDPLRLLDSDLSNINILFMDIDMPGINGITAGRSLRDKYPDLIIVFVTGFIQYARDGYSVAAFRYLLKDSLDVELPACLHDIHKKIYAQQECINIKGIEYSLKTRIQDILYFEGTSHRHVIMHTKCDTVECIGKLSEYESQFENHGFLRIQRSFLVNMFHIDWIKNYYVQLSTGESLKVSERSYSDVLGRYLMWKGQQL